MKVWFTLSFSLALDNFRSKQVLKRHKHVFLVKYFLDLTLMCNDKCRLSRVLAGGIDRIPASISAVNLLS